jgi:hypothetical protein
MALVSVLMMGDRIDQLWFLYTQTRRRTRVGKKKRENGCACMSQNWIMFTLACTQRKVKGKR